MPHRSLYACAAVAALVCLSGACASESGNGADPTEILWDRWGIPHVFAVDPTALLYASGWAQMHNHGDLILRLYGESRGRAAEYWGERYVDADRFLHTMGVPERSQQWLDAQSNEMTGLLGAFVAGMNAYAEAHPEALDTANAVVLPIVPTDVFSHLQRVIHLTFVGAAAAPTAERWSERGSNAWAIAPAHSGSGNAMLLANPHLPWSDLFTWMEMHLVTEGIDAYGATLVGFPALGIAFNEHLGWTHTNNTFDGTDLYELTLQDDGYLWDDATAAFETSTATIRVRQDDGRLREESFPVRRSVHGPVIASRNDKALAVRISGLDQAGFFEQYWRMLQATDLDEFEAAYSRLQNPFFNLVYADADGRIMYLFSGRTPRRPSGDWAAWQGLVDGTTAAMLWNDTLSYGELPRVVDPPGGWVQNANDPPWTSTFPQSLVADQFPDYLAPRGMGLRPQRSARMLIEDESISFEELVEYKHSTRVELADRVLDDLIAAARALGTEAATAAADVLERWDRLTDADSRGAVLFTEWAARRGRQWDYARNWSEAEPRTTPDGLADPRAAAEALVAAGNRISERHGSIDVAWGDVYRLRSGAVDLPGNGGPGGYGIFRSVNYRPTGDGSYNATSGDSYVAAIEFGPSRRAQALIGYGNASQAGSAHVGDQLELFSRKLLRPVWLTRQEIEANLESREEIMR